MSRMPYSWIFQSPGCAVQYAVHVPFMCNAQRACIMYRDVKFNACAIHATIYAHESHPQSDVERLRAVFIRQMDMYFFVQKRHLLVPYKLAPWPPEVGCLRFLSCFRIVRDRCARLRMRRFVNRGWRNGGEMDSALVSTEQRQHGALNICVVKRNRRVLS
jgi:hypothetical protein